MLGWGGDRGRRTPFSSGQPLLLAVSPLITGMGEKQERLPGWKAGQRGSGFRLPYSAEGNPEQFSGLVIGTSTSPFTIHQITLSINNPMDGKYLRNVCSCPSTPKKVPSESENLEWTCIWFSDSGLQGSAQGTASSQQNHGKSHGQKESVVSANGASWGSVPAPPDSPCARS